MKFRGLQFIIATGAAILLCSYVIHTSSISVKADSALGHEKDKLLVNILMKSLDNGHYQPKDVNDEFSKGAFNLYLERLDFSKRFFIL